MKNNTPWKVFACCLLVKGSKRSVICDLQRNRFFLIPNALYDILSKYESMSVEDVKNAFDSKENSIIEEYFDFLIENEIVFFTTDPHLFPKLNLDWHEPAKVTNAIIDLNGSAGHWKPFLHQVDQLGCKHIQCRFFSEINSGFLIEMLNELNNSNISSIEFSFSIESAVS